MSLSSRENTLKREYQYNFSSNSTCMYEALGRERKARTMVAVLEDHIRNPLNELHVLNVGGSAGIIDNYLADYFLSVTVTDRLYGAIPGSG
jgi:hypothetical protein